MPRTRAIWLVGSAAVALLGALAGFLLRPVLVPDVRPAGTVSAEAPEVLAAVERAEEAARLAAETAARAERTATRAERAAGAANDTATAARAESTAARALGRSALGRVEALEQDALRRGEPAPESWTRNLDEMRRTAERLEDAARHAGAPELPRPAPVAHPVRHAAPAVVATNASISTFEPGAFGEPVPCAAEGVAAVARGRLPRELLGELDEVWPDAGAALVRVGDRGTALVGGIAVDTIAECGDAAFLRADRRALAVAWTHGGRLWYRALVAGARPVAVAEDGARSPAGAVVGGEAWLFYQEEGRIRVARSESVDEPEFELGVVADADRRASTLEVHQHAGRLWVTWRSNDHTLELAVRDADTGGWHGLQVVIVEDDLGEAEEQARIWALRGAR